MRILSWDQSMANMGWSYLNIDTAGGDLIIQLMEKGIFHTAKKEGKAGFYDTIPRGDSIYRIASDLMLTLMMKYGRPEVVVHEMPSVMSKGSQSSREAPIVAVTALRGAIASVLPGTPIVIQQNQRMKKIVVGVSTAEKSEVKVAVMRYLGVETLRSNEHEIDSIALAIAAYRDGLLHTAIHENRGTVL